MTEFTPSKYQKAVLDFVMNGRGHGVVNAFAGSGKCLGRGTPVLMFDGTIKKVEEIRIGDQVMGPDSSPRKVLSLARGEEEMYEIIPTEGNPWTCNGSHIMTLVDSVTGEITDHSLQDVIRGKSTKFHDAKLLRAKVEFPYSETPLDPYLVGVWLGGGHKDVPKNNTQLKGQKGIPSLYLKNSRHIRLKVLAGLLDTDGHQTGEHYEITTEYDELKNDILFIARSLGLAAYALLETDSVKSLGLKENSWRISISGECSGIPCRVNKFPPRKQKENVLQTGFSIKPLGLGQYFGFTINGPDGRFLLGDFTVTHNTSTLAWIASYLKCDRILYAAFNKAIVEEAEAKFPKNVEVRTINSLGHGAIWVKNKEMKIDSSKYFRIINELLEQLEDRDKAPFQVTEETKLFLKESDPVQDLKKLCDFARNTLTDHTDPKKLSGMVDHYDLEINYRLFDFYCQALKFVLDRGRAMVAQSIDYNDQLWIPATDNRIWPKRFDFIMVDEAQDLSASKLAVVRKALKRGGRILFVGDRFQSIYGFSGAKTDSMDNIIQTTRAKEMPLSICYRCDKAILDEVRDYVPDIEARPGAAEGVVREVSREVMLKELHEGDLVLCRTNSPLLKLCFELIADGISAQIKGRDIGKNLLNTAEKIQKASGYSFEWRKFPSFAQQWLDRSVEQILAINGGNTEDPKIESMNDRIDCLIIIWSRGEVRSIDDMECIIEEIFSDDRPSVWLSSVHRAKGLENERVFIIERHLMPGPWAKPGTWQYTQELNLKYVSSTRAKHELIFVH